jgi:MFS family permease
MATRLRLPRAVVWLGVVSLATDASSDMIYPLLPLFLTNVLGASPQTLGIIEGAAEGTAALLKLISGRLADRARRRKPLTIVGYGISSVVRPLAGLATAAWMILAVRLSDRVGKGIRSSPRDALLADVTAPEHRGRAFGFHRAMDNAGAVVGPALATALLVWGHLSLRTIFFVAAVPGLVAMLALVFGVEEQARELAKVEDAVKVVDGGPIDPRRDAREAPGLGPYLGALALFSLGNASDAFLLLRAQELGVPARFIPLLWLVHNAVKAALSTSGGALSDRLGRRRVIFAGWLLYGLSYLGFGLAGAAWQAWVLFVVYGVYYALVEGSEKALIAELAPRSYRGRAFGWYYAVIGFSALPASFGFGALVQRYGAFVPFTLAAGLAWAAALLLVVLVPSRSAEAKARVAPRVE